MNDYMVRVSHINRQGSQYICDGWVPVRDVTDYGNRSGPETALIFSSVQKLAKRDILDYVHWWSDKKYYEFKWFTPEEFEDLRRVGNEYAERHALPKDDFIFLTLEPVEVGYRDLPGKGEEE